MAKVMLCWCLSCSAVILVPYLVSRYIQSRNEGSRIKDVPIHYDIGQNGPDTSRGVTEWTEYFVRLAIFSRD